MVAFCPRKYVQGGAKRQDLDTDMQKEYNRLDTQIAHNGVWGLTADMTSQATRLSREVCRLFEAEIGEGWGNRL